jgi:hypothetical protein
VVLLEHWSPLLHVRASRFKQGPAQQRCGAAQYWSDRLAAISRLARYFCPSIKPLGIDQARWAPIRTSKRAQTAAASGRVVDLVHILLQRWVGSSTVTAPK